MRGELLCFLFFAFFFLGWRAGGWRCAQGRLWDWSGVLPCRPQDPRRSGERPLPPDSPLPPEGAGRPRAPPLLPLRRRGGAARPGLEGERGLGCVCVGGVQRCLSMPPAPRTIPPLLVPAGSGARPLPAPLHLLGQPAGRAGRLLRLQRPGEGRRAQSLRRHPGEWPGGGRLGTPSLGFPRCPRSLPRWLWSAC